jgi:hypothetical protein
MPRGGQTGKFRSLLPPINGMTLPPAATPMPGQGSACRVAQRIAARVREWSSHGQGASHDEASPTARPEQRAAGQQAMAQAIKPIVKLPTKLVRQCGRCGEFGSVMVEPGQPAPEFKCKVCDRP